MKKLVKLLRARASAYKKRVVTLKTSVKDWRKTRKQDKRAIAQLEKGLLVLDSSGKSTSRGIDLYKQYRNGTKDGFLHSIQESVKLSLRDIATRLKRTDKQYEAALIASSVVIRKPARKHHVKKVLRILAVPVVSAATFVRKPVKPAVWKWLIFVMAVLAVLGLVTLFYSSRKVTVTNPTEPTPDTPVCLTWMMEAAPFTPKDNKFYDEGLQVVQDAKFGKSSENNEKALEVMQMYRNKKIYLLDVARSELSPNDWSKVNPDEISDTGSCANAKTNKLYQDVVFEVMHSQVSIENLPQPDKWYNSGIAKGKVVVDSKIGITGNIKSMVVRHPDGRMTAYLARCGNPSHKDQKDRDKGDTDEHHHKPTPPKPPKLTPKDPSKDVGANPKVAPWKKDNTGGDSSKGHQVSLGDGATVSNGLQTNPAADATAAKAAATQAAATNTAAHTEAKQDAVVVNSNQAKTASTPPPANW